MNNLNISNITGSNLPKLYSIIYNLDDYYHHFKQNKKKFGRNQIDNNGMPIPRQLCSVKYPLKQVLQKIHKFLLSIPIPEYAFGSIPGKNNIKNAALHAKNKYFFSIDLKDFFTMINCHQVESVLKSLGLNELTAKCLTQLTTYKGHLIQGAPSSPILSNIVFYDTGNRILDFIKDKEITFSTFLDDITFSAEYDFNEYHTALLSIIKDGRFYINYKKIKYRSGIAEVTGLFVYKNQLYLEKKMKKYMFGRLSCYGYLNSICKENRKLRNLHKVLKLHLHS